MKHSTDEFELAESTKPKKAVEDLNMKLTEVETAYEHYREKTEEQLIELRDKLRTLEESKESEDSLRKELFD